ncbi:TPR repeat-containing thioredoxin TTL1-like [Chenopodium quinoa]|uniref:TPR repeat-containing thioredoxin TTL1-like n=1 Tax=Chenopodium quinoa TaxID=63459 RepID=UPI000B76BB10|nr:TPR repeat-containing thioredoxin TTL1-like [Chenopodium quinoa]XP_021743857.1 TPR repeat-containing thioredoxin TTL1-like [Chenopodium quinoa]XP_021743858.1 TPR repeat-containing thioredoxin TTL1-like [Chenopodium quinoa]
MLGNLETRKVHLQEGDTAIAAGADYSPQLFSCRVESLLKLRQLDDIDSILSHIPKVEPSPNCCSQSKFIGMLSDAYLFYVRAQIGLRMQLPVLRKLGRLILEVAKLLKNVRLVARARARRNDRFKSHTKKSNL